MQNMCVHMPCSMGTKLQASTMSSKANVNVCLELQRRQWLAVEGWDCQLLHRYCEYRTLQCVRSNACASSCHEVVSARNTASTVTLAFSCDGNFMAIGNLHHDVTIFRTTPRMQQLQTLSTHHSRTPWCLVFDPTEDQILYSGGLEGNVCRWNFETGECLKALKSGLDSPVNGITCLPSTPGYILVAKDHWLSLVNSSSLDIVWQVSTGNPICRVRLIMFHPQGGRILTAIGNEPPPSEQTPFAYSLRTPFLPSTYKLQLYPFDRDCRPDLEDSSYGLLCLSARIYGQHSCTITNSAVICISIKNNVIHLSVYSVVPETFGQCVYSIPVAQLSGTNSFLLEFPTGETVQHYDTLNIVSLNMSPCNSYLLLGIARKKNMDIYHMGRRHDPGPIAKILQFNPEPDAVKKLQPVCTLITSDEPISRSLSCNVALWGPPRAGGGVFMGVTRGGVVAWGSSFTMDSVGDIELMTEWDDVNLSKKKLKT